MRHRAKPVSAVTPKHTRPRDHKKTQMSKVDDATATVKKSADKVADAAKAGTQQTGQALKDAGKAVKKAGR